MKRMSSIRISVIVCAALAVSVSASAQMTHYVSPDGTCGGNTPCYSTIQAAIDGSASGDEIIVAPGTYAPFSLNVTGNSRTIKSSHGPEVTIVDGGGAARAISTFSHLTLQGLTIANGQTTGEGGGVHLSFGSPIANIDDCIFLNNTANNGGGAIGGGSNNLLVTNCSFIGNSTGQNGGAIRVSGLGAAPFYIADCVFENNIAGVRGGAIGDLMQNATVIGCTFEGNSAIAANGGGGAIHAQTFDTSVIDDCHFTNNAATQGHGGAIWMTTGSSTVQYDFITNCTFTSNTAAISGGGVVLAGAARMASSTLTGNTAATGGGATLSGTSSIDNCTISDNEATGDGDGGGARLEGNASIINSPVTDNSAGGNGGGLWLNQASATACTISGNTAAGHGGGLYMIGATATDCPITGNVATGRGGGAYAQAGASHLVNCEISLNTAGTSGGGVYIMDAALVNLIDSTICPNSPDLIDFHIGGMLLTMNSISCEMTCPGGDPIGACCLPQGGCAALSEANCIAVGGTFQGDGTSCAKAECPDPEPTCIGDLNGDGVVDVSDLLILLSAWGMCP